MFFSAKKILGLDIGTSSVKLAEVDVNGSSATLRKFSFYPLDAGSVNGGEVVEPVAVSQVITALVNTTKTKRKHVSTGMWGTSVIVKKISMPRMDAKLVAEQIRWEAEQYIPFDVNEISIDHAILKKSGGSAESMDVLLVAAKQEFVFKYVEAIESSGLKCSIIDVSGFALANCFQQNYGVQPGNVVLLNIGAGVTNFVVVNNGEVVFSRDIAVGGLLHTTEISKTLGINVAEAESLKVSACLGQAVPQEVNNLIQAMNDSIVDEIRNSFEFFLATSGGGGLTKFYVTGGSIFLPGLIDAIARNTGLPFEVMDPLRQIKYDRKVFSEDLIAQIKSIAAVSIGLGMRKMVEK